MSTKAVVRINEMPPEMAEEAFIHGMDALETQFNESDMAAYVKEKFEEQYGGLWHCFVGRNFGAFVTLDFVCFVILFFKFCALETEMVFS